VDWAAHDHRAPDRQYSPAPEPIEVCWRIIGPSEVSKPMTCAIYQAPAWRFEVRLGYAYDNPIRTQLARSRQAAQDIAAIWKMTACAKGFTELPPAA
jgi:hypothetical protein